MSPLLRSVLGILTAASLSLASGWTRARITVLDPHHRPFANATLRLDSIIVPGYTTSNYGSVTVGYSVDTDSTGTATLDLDSAVVATAEIGVTIPTGVFQRIQTLYVSKNFGAGAAIDTSAWENVVSVSIKSTRSILTVLDTLAAAAPNVGDSLYVDTVIVDYAWQPSDAEEDSGTVTFPGVPYQILYDPPGDGSFTWFESESTFTTGVTTSFGATLGATLGFGYSYENELLGSGAEFEVTASVNYAQESENSFSTTVSSANGLQTPSGDESTTLGPGRGDKYVCPMLKMRWHLYRVYAPHDSDAYDDGYAYKIFYRLLPDPTSPLIYVTAAQLADYIEDTAALAQIRAASVVDPATGRLREGLVDSNGTPLTDRLTLVGDALIAGGSGGFDNTTSATVTKAVTLTRTLDVSTTVSAKVKAYGATASASITAGITVGGSGTEENSSRHSLGYSLDDANIWDTFHCLRYLDNAYGTWVIVAQGDSNWSSLPVEDLYSSPSVLLDLTADHDTLVAAPGESVEFHLRARNTSRPGLASVDTLKGVSADVRVNSGANVETSGELWNVNRVDTSTFVVVASAEQAGTYPIEIAFSGTVGSTEVDYEQTRDLVLLVSDDLSGLSSDENPGEIGLRGTGRSLNVRSPAGRAWTLRILDLSGRTLFVQTGSGSRTLDIPSAAGVTYQELASGSTRIHRLSPALP